MRDQFLLAGGDLIVSLRINEACDALTSPAWTHTWTNAGNNTYNTADILVQPAPISVDATVRWCTEYTGDANNAPRPLGDDNEVAQLNFYPLNVFAAGAFGMAIPLLLWGLWNRKRRNAAE